MKAMLAGRSPAPSAGSSAGSNIVISAGVAAQESDTPFRPVRLSRRILCCTGDRRQAPRFGGLPSPRDHAWHPGAVLARER
jgi:hypothetical protein